MTRIFHRFFVKMDSLSGFEIRRVFTFPPKDRTLQYKKCAHLKNKFPCISTLMSFKNEIIARCLRNSSRQTLLPDNFFGIKNVDYLSLLIFENISNCKIKQLSIYNNLQKRKITYIKNMLII